MSLRPAAQDDALGISVLLATVFDRPDEARLIDHLRGSGQMAAEFVVEENGGIVAHTGFAELQSPSEFWHLVITAVSQSKQRQGLGTELIVKALDQARRDGVEGVVVVGAPDYYRRLGFSTGPVREMTDDLSGASVSFRPLKAGVTTHGRTLRFAPTFARRYG